MRLIDADALKKAVEDFPNCYNGWSDTYDKSFIIGEIEEQPSIDIVRCKECKHWERLNYEAPKEGWCDDEMPYSDGRWVDADDFCSYGERNDNE